MCALSNIRFSIPGGRSYKTGDTFPPAEVQIDGAPSTLSGATATASLRDREETLLFAAESATVADVAAAGDGTYSGRVYRNWSDGDLDVAGIYVVDFEVTLSDGSIVTAPPDDRYRIRVRAAADGEGSLQQRPFGHIEQTSHGFSPGVPTPARSSVSGYVKAVADSLTNVADCWVVAADADWLRVYGDGQHITVSGYTAGDSLYLHQSTDGGVLTADPGSGVRQRLGVVDATGILPRVDQAVFSL